MKDGIQTYRTRNPGKGLQCGWNRKQKGNNQELCKPQVFAKWKKLQRMILHC